MIPPTPEASGERLTGCQTCQMVSRRVDDLRVLANKAEARTLLAWCDEMQRELQQRRSGHPVVSDGGRLRQGNLPAAQGGDVAALREGVWNPNGEGEQPDIPGGVAKDNARAKMPVIAYACLYPRLAAVAREHGYALAMHGSLVADCDLIAVPWSENIGCDDATLAKALTQAAGGVLYLDEWPKPRPGGVRKHIIHLGGGPYLDLAVVSPAALDARLSPPQAGGVEVMANIVLRDGKVCYEKPQGAPEASVEAELRERLKRIREVQRRDGETPFDAGRIHELLCILAALQRARETGAEK